jgi:glycosyltransferase involved in cell wall biosynthesis
VAALTARLPSSRFDSRLFAGEVSPGEAEMTEVLAREGVAPVKVPGLGRAIRLRDDALALARLVAEFRRFRPHIVHTHTAKGGALGRVAASICGTPLVVHTFHGHVFHGYFSKPATEAFLAIERALALVTDAVVTISPRQHADITKRFRVAPARKTHVVPLGFDLRKFESLGGHRGSLRAEIGSVNAPIVSIVGRLTPIKDHALLFRSVQELPGVRLCVVGGGECEASLRDLAAELGIADRTHFLGVRSDLDRILADTDVVALTSFNEGTPVALIEALAAGCSIVAVSVGGVPDLLEEGRWGRLVSVRSPKAVAGALRSALGEHRGRSPETVTAGQRHAQEKYGVERLVRDHVSLYEGLLARAGLSAR